MSMNYPSNRTLETSISSGMESFESSKNAKILRILQKCQAIDATHSISVPNLASTLGVQPKFIFNPLSKLLDDGFIDIVECDDVPHTHNKDISSFKVWLTKMGTKVQSML